MKVSVLSKISFVFFASLGLALGPKPAFAQHGGGGHGGGSHGGGGGEVSMVAEVGALWAGVRNAIPRRCPRGGGPSFNRGGSSGRSSGFSSGTFGRLERRPDCCLAPGGRTGSSTAPRANTSPGWHSFGNSGSAGSATAHASTSPRMAFAWKFRRVPGMRAPLQFHELGEFPLFR